MNARTIDGARITPAKARMLRALGAAVRTEQELFAALGCPRGFNQTLAALVGAGLVAHRGPTLVEATPAGGATLAALPAELGRLPKRRSNPS